MKYTLIVFALLLTIPLAGQLNEKSKSLDDQKPGQESFLNLLDKLTSQFQVEFAYDVQLDIKNIEADFNTFKTLDQSLENIFQYSEIEYEIQDKLVLLRNKPLKKETISFKGQVIDLKSGIPLPYTLITGKNNNKSLFADSLGMFELYYPSSSLRDSLEFSYLGYKKQLIAVKDLSGSPQINLVQASNKIPQINILSPAYHIDRIYLYAFSPIQKMEISSSLISGDILRSVQLEAGISAHNDLSSEIKIRGTEAYESMILLDNMVIYNPTHFYNLFSAVNGNYVSETEVFKNNLPIEQISKTGGLIRMKSKNLEHAVFDVSGDIDLLNAAVKMELPVSKNSGLLLAARTSYTDLINTSLFKTISGNNSNENQNLTEKLVKELEPSFNFYDLNAKYQGRFKNNQGIDLNFYVSRDNYSNVFYTDIIPRKNIDQYLFDYDDQSSWQNLGISTNYHFSLSELHSSNLTLNYSQSRFGEDFNFTNNIQSMSLDRTFSYNNNISNEIEDMHLNWANKLSFKNGSKYTIGLETGIYKTNTLIANTTSVILTTVQEESPFSLYQEYKGQTGEILYHVGLRMTYLLNKADFIVDPRLSFSYPFSNSGGSFHGALSINHQFLSQFSYENHLGQDYAFWVLSGEEFPLLKSYNSMLGYQLKKQSYSFSSEIYYRHRTGLTEFALLKPGVPDQNSSADETFFLFTGTGNILGLDLAIKKTSGSYRSALNYTLSSNLVSFENIFNGKAFPDRDHRLHQMKWLNSYSINSINFSMNAIFSSGKPYIDVSQLNNNKLRKDLIIEDQLSYLPYYLRFDAGIQYTLPVLRKKVTIGCSIYNLLNRKNLYNIQYIKPVTISGPNTHEFIATGAESSLLGRTINFRLSFDF